MLVHASIKGLNVNPKYLCLYVSNPISLKKMNHYLKSAAGGPLAISKAWSANDELTYFNNHFL